MRVLVTGGTGTLGTEIIDQIKDQASRITVFSRDEQKQQSMKRSHPHLEYIVGDVRDYDSVATAVKKADRVFHCAAMKHVDVCEANPKEAIKTNLMGTINVVDAINAKEDGTRLYFSSTDKAVLPINVYGKTKALAEDYVLSQKSEYFKVFRWGNIVGSKGSVVPIFVDKLQKREPIPITDPNMTRFWLPIDVAASFMISSSEFGSDQVYIPDMKGSKVISIIRALADIMGIKTYKLETVGIRPGEKIHECIKTSHEHCVRSDNCEQYSDGELFNLLEPFVVKI